MAAAYTTADRIAVVRAWDHSAPQAMEEADLNARIRKIRDRVLQKNTSGQCGYISWTATTTRLDHKKICLILGLNSQIPVLRAHQFSLLTNTTDAENWPHQEDVLSPSHRWFSCADVVSRYVDEPCPQFSAVEGIHANRIGVVTDEENRTFGPPVYVAAQAPMLRQFNAFWSALVREKISCVVNLTESQEKGADRYWPEQVGGVVDYSGVRVTRIDPGTMQNKPDWVEKLEESFEIICCKVQIQDSSHHVWICRHQWEDHTPISLEALINLMESAASIPSVPLIHCSAGLGRTGTFGTAMILKKMATQGMLTKENFGQVVLSLIWQMKEQRGPNALREEWSFYLLLEYAEFLVS